jgi:hypothetical protein
LKEQVAKLEAQVKQLTDAAESAKKKNEILAAESASLRKKLREALTSSENQTADNPQPDRQRNWGGRGGGPRGMMRRAFGEVLAKMNLTEEQQNKLFDLLGSRADAASSVIQQALKNGQTDPASLIAAIKAKNSESDQQIAALLGPQYAQFKEAQDGVSDRFALSRFQDQITKSGAALQDFQSTAINQVMNEERLKNQQTVMGAVGFFDPRIANTLPQTEIDAYMSSQQDYSQRVQQRLMSVLNPDQQKALSDSLGQMVQMQQRGLQWARQRAQENQPPPPPPGP